MTTYDRLIDAFYGHVSELIREGKVTHPLNTNERLSVQWFAAWMCERYNLTAIAPPPDPRL